MLKLEKIISKSKLENLYLKKKLSDAQIGAMFNVSLGRIHRLRNRYNIKAIEYHRRHHKQELDQNEKEFLVGTLLGDGHLRRRGKKNKSYPQLMLEQSTKHSEYAFWLKDQVKDWLFNPDKPLKQVRKVHKRTGKVYHSYPFQTICHPVFIEFYDAFYNNKRKIITIEFIEKYFSPFSLAVWLMDDGTLDKNSRIKLCTCSFSYKENKLLQNFLHKKFNFNLKVKYEGKYPILIFNTKTSCDISRMVKEYFTSSMLYKLVSSETTKEAKQYVLKV